MADISKVVYGDNVLIDLTSDTAIPEYVKQGITFHGANGATQVGEQIAYAPQFASGVTTIGTGAGGTYIECGFKPEWVVASIRNSANVIKFTWVASENWYGNGTSYQCSGTSSGTLNTTTNNRVANFTDNGFYMARATNAQFTNVTWMAWSNTRGIIPSGNGVLDIVRNGSYPINSYNSVNVNVPVNGVHPYGTYNITSNGLYNIYEYDKVNVRVEGGGGGDIKSLVNSDFYISSVVHGVEGDYTARRCMYTSHYASFQNRPLGTYTGELQVYVPASDNLSSATIVVNWNNGSQMVEVLNETLTPSSVPVQYPISFVVDQNGYTSTSLVVNIAYTNTGGYGKKLNPDAAMILSANCVSSSPLLSAPKLMAAAPKSGSLTQKQLTPEEQEELDRANAIADIEAQIASLQEYKNSLQS